MTSFGFCFRPSLDRDTCSGPLVLWIEHEGKTTFVPTPYDVDLDEFDRVFGRLVPPEDHPERAEILAGYEERMERDLARIEDVVSRLDKSGHYTVDDIMKHYQVVLA